MNGACKGDVVDPFFQYHTFHSVVWVSVSLFLFIVVSLALLLYESIPFIGDVENCVYIIIGVD